MSETKMPAAEAEGVDAPERVHYELAFHVLPTVAEGEVTTVFQNLKDTITKHGGEITLEEAPARFDLAYEIIKYLEGRNRKFSSAYFGWIRFTMDPAQIDETVETVEGVKELLRHLLIKLTKTEEENPFYFHEALIEKKSETIDLDEEEKPAAEKDEKEADSDDSSEGGAETKE